SWLLHRRRRDFDHVLAGLFGNGHVLSDGRTLAVLLLRPCLCREEARRGAEDARQSAAKTARPEVDFLAERHIVASRPKLDENGEVSEHAGTVQMLVVGVVEHVLEARGDPTEDAAEAVHDQPPACNAASNALA